MVHEIMDLSKKRHNMLMKFDFRHRQFGLVQKRRIKSLKSIVEVGNRRTFFLNKLSNAVYCSGKCEEVG